MNSRFGEGIPRIAHSTAIGAHLLSRSLKAGIYLARTLEPSAHLES